MSSAETIKVELEALSDLRYQLQVFKEKLEPALVKVQRVVQEESARLNEICTKRQTALSKAQIAYDRCTSFVDEDGHRLPCNSELSDLRLAQQALEEAVAQKESFIAQAERCTNNLANTRQTVESSIDESSQYLYKHITQTLIYLKGNDVAIPATPGQDPHGAAYQRARSRWFREAANGDFENEPSHLRGWMRQEVNARGYYGSPDGYDTGHFIRNLNIPENFRWEASDMNQGRSTRAMRYYPYINNF